MGSGLPKLSDTTRISPNIVRILGQNPGLKTLQGTNSYLISDTALRRILVDTTSDGGGLSKYTSLMQEQLTSSFISDIIITHWHPDHVGGINAILRLHGQNSDSVKIHKYKSDSAPSLQDLGIHSKNIHDLKNGQILPMSDELKLHVVYTPGHASDHVCLLLKESDVPTFLFTGDIILGHGSTLVEYLPHYMDSLNLLRDMVKNNPSITLLPAHGDIVPLSLSKVDEYISNRQSRIDKCYKYLCDKQSTGQVKEEPILDVVYSETPAALKPVALINLRHSLFYLQEKSPQLGLTPENGFSYDDFVQHIRNPEALNKNNPMLNPWIWNFAKKVY
ncbi:Beta-lactamase-like protein 2 [Cichlidogyrus casuarinus]|uniref:Beta-lactamase-like protein 2 n=1 Tax=Cichlidogyrus casuarinus TaxID=1844966 RepID=A0ABD2QDE9_9PLAT